MKKLTTLAALLLASGLAMAESGDFSSADANGDGSLDAEEAQTAGVDMAADTDGDGKISQEEYDAAKGS